MLNSLSSALYMPGTKSSLVYVLFTNSDTELWDINLSIFLVELADLRSVVSFLRNWFLFVCQLRNGLRSPSISILLFVLALLVGCAKAASHTYTHRVLLWPSAPSLPGYPFLLKLPLDLSGLLAFYFTFPVHFWSFRSPTHWIPGFTASFLSLCHSCQSPRGPHAGQSFLLWPSWHHLDALKWCHFSSMLFYFFKKIYLNSINQHTVSVLLISEVESLIH